MTVNSVNIASVTQSCPTLWDPMDCSPAGSSVHGILQGTILELVAMPSSRDLPNPGIKPRSPALEADSLPSEPPGTLSKWDLRDEVFIHGIHTNFVLGISWSTSFQQLIPYPDTFPKMEGREGRMKERRKGNVFLLLVLTSKQYAGQWYIFWVPVWPPVLQGS